MLIPQYSIRWLLALTAACAAVFSIFALGLRGSQWAQGVSIGIVSLVVVLLVGAGLFALLWVFSVLTSGASQRLAGFGRSPFVHDLAAADRKPPDAPSEQETTGPPIVPEQPPADRSEGDGPQG